jgi:hypothetical protein
MGAAKERLVLACILAFAALFAAPAQAMDPSLGPPPEWPLEVPTGKGGAVQAVPMYQVVSFVPQWLLSDAVTALKICSGTPVQAGIPDADGDGAVEPADAARILQIIAGRRS